MPLPRKLAAAESRRLLRQRIGRDHVLLTGRGATAIWASLRALNLHDRPVLLPANTCYIVLWAVLQSGNHPFLVDVDPLTANISLQTLDQCSVESPAVLIPAHMYGLPAPMASITAWAKARNVFVIEDVALALGTISDGKPAGVWGDVSIFSFGAGKIADAGNGGALLTDDAALAAEIERILAALPLWSNQLERLNRQWLEIYWALHQFESENVRLAEVYPMLFSIYGSITQYRLPESAAQRLRNELLNLDDQLARRAALARLYDQSLAALSAAPVRLFERQFSTLWRYPLLVSKGQRNPLLERLWSEGIFEATRWYPSLQPMRNALAPNLPLTATPATDQLSEEIINLPLDPEKVPQVIAIISDFFEA